MIEERDYAVAATVGARRRQEDCSGFDDRPPPLAEGAPGLLAVVADGMGGGPAGDRASLIVVNEFLSGFARAESNEAAERLSFALECANDALARAIRADRENFLGANGEQAGSTLVAALFFPDRFCWISVGDSLILRCRRGTLARINELHVYAAELDEQARRNEVSVEFARGHPDRAALTSAVLGEPISKVDLGVENLLADDVLLLATDGIDTLGQTELREICTAEAGGEDARGFADAIIGRVEQNQRAGQDNATVFVVRRGDYVRDDEVTRRVRVGSAAHGKEGTDMGCADSNAAMDSGNAVCAARDSSAAFQFARNDNKINPPFCAQSQKPLVTHEKRFVLAGTNRGKWRGWFRRFQGSEA